MCSAGGMCVHAMHVCMYVMCMCGISQFVKSGTCASVDLTIIKTTVHDDA